MIILVVNCGSSSLKYQVLDMTDESVLCKGNAEKIGLEDEYKVPNLHESVSKGKDGKIHITLGNLSCSEAYDVSSTLMGNSIKSVKATIVGGKMDDHNTFDEPEVVSEKVFDGVSFEGDKLSFKIPASSVMHIEVEI